MPIKVGFWNVNMGPGSFQAKKDVFREWCAAMQPDLLCLEEDSFTSTGASNFAKNCAELEGLSGMKVLNYVQTLDVNGDPSSKNLVALAGSAGFQARALQFPTFGVDDARRMLLLVTWIGDPGLRIWAIHANASRSGGQVAARCVSDYLSTPAGSGSVVGGDFNFTLNLAPAAWQRLCPLNWAEVPARFTQWNQNGNIPRTPADFEALMLPNRTAVNVPIKPNVVLDYAVGGASRTVKPLKNMPYEIWPAMLPMFDHAPVLYEIS